MSQAMQVVTVLTANLILFPVLFQLCVLENEINIIFSKAYKKCETNYHGCIPAEK